MTALAVKPCIGQWYKWYRHPFLGWAGAGLGLKLCWGVALPLMITATFWQAFQKA